MSLKEISSSRCFDGVQKEFSHFSAELSCEMKVAIYLPAKAVDQTEVKFPVLYYLSGLTCNESNCVQKGGFQRLAEENGIIVVCPDTSPRNIPELKDIEASFSWDFGYGAGFYLDATEEKLKKNFRMFSYVTEELIKTIEESFPASNSRSIFGHSMGGHGALICALKNPGLYKSVSAFAPICNPLNCQWGQKAFRGYLGPNEEQWKEYDATELIRKANPSEFNNKIFIDQGSEDQFLKDGQLLPGDFIKAAEESKISIEYKLRDGYDHSYFFISTFMNEHFDFHKKFLF